MTTWGTFLDRAKRRYALTAGVADPQMGNELFLDAANERIQELLAGTEGARESFQVNLQATPVALSNRVIRIIDRTVRIDYDGDGTAELQLDRIDEDELREAVGVLELEPVGTPSYFYVQRGSAADAMQKLATWPRSDRAVTNGVLFDARCHTAALVDTNSTLPLQLGEERFLIPGICLALAEYELAEGRDAPVGYWARAWEKALTDFQDAVEESFRGNHRTIHYSDD